MASLADRVLRSYNQMFHSAALYPSWSVELSSLVVVMVTETCRHVA
jgi:hypothetical protein